MNGVRIYMYEYIYVWTHVRGAHAVRNVPVLLNTSLSNMMPRYMHVCTCRRVLIRACAVSVNIYIYI